MWMVLSTIFCAIQGRCGLLQFLDQLKNVIQDLFEIQSAVHGYLGPETQQQLIRKMYTGFG